MSPQRWSRIEELYHSARDCEPEGREAFLRQVCGDDEQLLDQLKLLLEQDRSENEILDRPAMDLLSEAGPDRLAAGAILGPYRIEVLLGAGGMGRVYKAHDSRLGRSVAIKVAAQRFSDRFGREARAIAALNHPNICTLHDIGPNYLVMELVEGPTLADRIRQGPVGLEGALPIARQIAEALEAAHEKGIVHRDLKPANIKVRPDGTVKVLDFGLAKAAELDGSPVDSRLEDHAGTEPGRIMGTAAYMSPEQARGDKVDKRTDIWAFGVVVYEMLAGRRLFEGATASDTIAAVLKEQPDFDRVPEPARKMLERCLEKDPRRRLRDIADAMPLLQDTPRLATTRAPWLAWTAAAAVAFAALAVSWVHFHETKPMADPMRFQIALPENMKLTSGGAFAVSPDGRKLVFAAIGPDTVSRLWLRSLNSVELKPLQDGQITPIASSIIWSPDSRFIMFRSGLRLEKMDVSSGLSQTLCEAPVCGGADTPGGGSWNRSDKIIYGVDSEPYVILQLAGNGGTPIPVTRLNGPGQIHGYPIFLPDGEHFLYSRWSPVAGNRGIYVGSLSRRPEEQDSKMLLRLDLPSASSAYVPLADSVYGELLYMRDQTLLAQRFDRRRLMVNGEPVAIAEHVGSNSHGTGFFSASNNGVLVYRSGEARVMKQITWLDRSGNIVGTPCEPGLYLTDMLRLSPDGTRAAYYQPDEATGINAVWMADLVGGRNTRVTTGPTHSGYPIWSPDGKRVAYGSPRDGFTAIYQKAASGAGDEELLAKLDPRAHLWDWTADGRYLIYSVRDAKMKLDLWALPIGGKPFPVVNTEYEEYDARVSPDGRWIAYMSNQTGRNEIYVQTFRKGIQPDKVMVSTKGAMGMPHWRRDGRELLYLSLDGAIMSVPIAPGPTFRQGPPQLLFRVPQEYFRLATMPGMLVDPTSDHQRFLLLLPVDRNKHEFTVVLNWMAALKPH
jgi:Tol biopolymer transport system component